MDLAAARELIVRHEGLRLKVYDDATGRELLPGHVLVGKLTAGYGYNLTDRGISKQTAVDWLDEDLATCVNDLLEYSFFAGLSDARQAALIDLRYNVGEAGFQKFVKLMAALNRQDYDAAAREIVSSQLAPGRKHDLARLMQVGQFEAA